MTGRRRSCSQEGAAAPSGPGHDNSVAKCVSSKRTPCARVRAKNRTVFRVGAPARVRISGFRGRLSEMPWAHADDRSGLYDDLLLATVDSELIRMSFSARETRRGLVKKSITPLD